MTEKISVLTGSTTDDVVSSGWEPRGTTVPRPDTTPSLVNLGVVSRLRHYLGSRTTNQLPVLTRVKREPENASGASERLLEPVDELPQGDSAGPANGAQLDQVEPALTRLVVRYPRLGSTERLGKVNLPKSRLFSDAAEQCRENTGFRRVSSACHPANTHRVARYLESGYDIPRFGADDGSRPDEEVPGVGQ